MISPPQGLIATGVGSAAFPLLAPNGSATAPSFSSSTAPTFGVYYETSGSAGLRIRLGPGTNTLPSVNLNTEASPIGLYKSGVGLGVIVAAAGASPQMLLGHFGHGAIVIPSGGYFALHSGSDVTTGNPDTILNRDGAGIFAQRNSTSAQILRVYNTWTDASNGEWFEANWQVTANTLIFRNMSNGTGSARGIGIYFPNSTAYAMSVSTLAAGGVGLGLFATSTTNVTKVSLGRYGGAGSISATTGTHTTVLIDESIAPSASATMIVRGLAIAPTINYASGGAGAVHLLKFAPTNTALPTGNNAAIALSSTADALGGIHHYNTSDEVTNTEILKERFVSNVYTIESTNAGTGTLRDIQIGPTGGLWTFDASPLGRLTAAGNFGFAHGTSALATTATEGYFHMNSCAGAPTGVPASIPSGQIPMVIDSTNSRIYAYIGGAWKSVAVA